MSAEDMIAEAGQAVRAVALLTAEAGVLPPPSELSMLLYLIGEKLDHARAEIEVDRERVAARARASGAVCTGPWAGQGG